jgi:hypothetical protein
LKKKKKINIERNLIKNAQRAAIRLVKESEKHEFQISSLATNESERVRELNLIVLVLITFTHKKYCKKIFRLMHNRSIHNYALNGHSHACMHIYESE